MRVVVTGATGFIGGAFVRRALAAGHHVLAVARSRERAATLRAHPALAVALGTLSEPPWTAIERLGADVCLHAAWITQPADYRQSPENRRLQAESLAFARGLFARGIRAVVALGSCEEYAPAVEPLDEARSPLRPASPYAQAKHELRLALADAAERAGARLSWGRVFQPYGVGEHPGRLPSVVVRRLKRGERVILQTPRALRDWIHVDDVAAALVGLVEAKVAGIFNIGTGSGHTVEQVALTLARRLGRADLIDLTGAAADHAGGLVADAGRLRALGWTPRVQLDTGLAALAEQVE